MQNQINYKIISIEEKELWPLEEVKNYLRVTHKNDDNLIKNLIKSAIDYAERFLRTGFFTKKIICSTHSAPSILQVKYKPILKLNKVHLVNGENKRDITEDFGHIDSQREKIYIQSKYWGCPIEIEYEAGFEGNIPSSILQGILMHIGNMYDSPENATNFSSEIRDMYLPYRCFSI